MAPSNGSCCKTSDLARAVALPVVPSHPWQFRKLALAPIENAAVIHAAAPVIYQTALGTPDTDPITLPADSIQAIPTYQAALAAFSQLPEIRGPS